MNELTLKVLTLEEVRRIYNTSTIYDFPDNERKPLSMIENALAAGTYDCYGITDGSEIMGYAFFYRTQEHYLIDYFAVVEKFRSGGIGTEFLRMLEAVCRERTVVVEVEDPDQAETEEERLTRIRRRSFYLKNGYWDTGVTVQLFGVCYRLLFYDTGARPQQDVVREIYREIYRAMLPVQLFERFVKV